FVDVDLQAALSNLAETRLRNRVFHNLARLQIELSDELGIEIRIPEIALPIEDLVMWRGIRSRQLIGRVDHLGPLALRPRQCLQWKFKSVRRTQVDRAEVLAEIDL